MFASKQPGSPHLRRLTASRVCEQADWQPARQPAHRKLCLQANRLPAGANSQHPHPSPQPWSNSRSDPHTFVAQSLDCQDNSPTAVATPKDTFVEAPRQPRQYPGSRSNTPTAAAEAFPPTLIASFICRAQRAVHWGGGTQPSWTSDADRPAVLMEGRRGRGGAGEGGGHGKCVSWGTPLWWTAVRCGDVLCGVWNAGQPGKALAARRNPGTGTPCAGGLAAAAAARRPPLRKSARLWTACASGRAMAFRACCFCHTCVRCRPPNPTTKTKPPAKPCALNPRHTPTTTLQSSPSRALPMYATPVKRTSAKAQDLEHSRF
eukprot:340576-Chlamydomonas_euryale.AAC.2